MSGEMAQMVLICIFSDEKVLKSLELGRMFQNVKGGKAPEGLLTTFKKTLGKHMKENFYVYQKEIKEEIAHIQRILDLKARMIALMGSLILSALIGVANFASQYLYGFYMGDDN